MRIAFLLEKPVCEGPVLSAVTTEVIGRLQARGVRVDVMTPEDGPVEIMRLRPQHDLYVLKSKTPWTLGLAGALTVAGAPLVNSVRSCNLARDKVATAALLAGSGVPVPASWATGTPAVLRSLFDAGPLWMKPPGGSRGKGVSRLSAASDLTQSEPCTDTHGLPLPVFAQRDVPSRGPDLKVYVVGERLWAVAKPFPARCVEDKNGAAAALPAEIRRTAHACGEVLGLELYGVDLRVGREGFYVVDVNAYPGYKGAAEAPRHLADYIHGRARRPCAKAV